MSGPCSLVAKPSPPNDGEAGNWEAEPEAVSSEPLPSPHGRNETFITLSYSLLDVLLCSIVASSRRSVSWEQRDNRRRAKKIKKNAGEEVRERLWANLTNSRSAPS